ncbi:MAG: hypothetical protein LBV72_17815 [Tannerella sp.]|jgi:AraC-like DNA-binding protein|nr:hypothetical protein [Tannerella sp.]
MTDTQNILQVLTFSAPMLVSFFCCLLMLFAHRKNQKHTKPKEVLLVIAVYLCSVFFWLSMVFYVALPVAFAYVQSFTYLSMLFSQVIIYHIAFLLTTTQKNERFSFVHYLIPLLIAGTLFIWSFFVPFDIQLSIVMNRSVVPEGYEAYTALFTSKPLVFFLYNIICSCLCLFRIRNYRKTVINYSADEHRSSLRWFYVLCILTLGTLPVTILFFLLGSDAFMQSALTFMTLILTILQDVILCYNLFAINYIIISPNDEEVESSNEKQTGLSRNVIEQYFREEKPYLNPELKITDLIVVLNTNRTYLSAFINQEYGMNFRRFINYWRLKEYEELGFESKGTHFAGKERAFKAGFSDYRGYVRAKKEYDKNPVSFK